jgi:MFS family permease
MLGGSLAAAGVGLLLDWARPRGLVGPTLGALQILACLCGVVTVLLMRRQHDPSPERDPVPVSLREAVAPLGDRRARGLFTYYVAWNGAVGLAGSFFALHMLQNLKMGFALVALHGATTAAFRMLAAPLWGALIDRLGARPVLVACSFGIAGIPFLWLLPTEARLWPLAIDAALAGLFWSGHSLAVFALPLAITRRRERPFFIAALAAVGGLAFAAATGTAGALAACLPATLSPLGFPIYNLQVLFVLSGVLRLGGAMFSLRIQEPSAGSTRQVLRLILGGVLRRARARGPVWP